MIVSIFLEKFILGMERKRPFMEFGVELLNNNLFF